MLPFQSSDGGLLPFQPSNISLAGIDLSKVTDEDISSNCEIRNGVSDCFAEAAYARVTQSDGSEVAVFVVKSLKIEPGAHVFLSSIGGSLPIAIVSLGHMTILGSIDGHAQDVHAAPGGFESVQEQDGAGPGGGPKGTSQAGAGGASYCGVGGAGAVVTGSGGSAGAPKPASGTPEIVPLRGGASGGGGVGSRGGGGGAGLQLVAGGAFSMGAGSYIDVGGGGGGFGVTAGGGGAGGSILIEASTIQIAGRLAANGGGGGGAGTGLDSGKNGSADSTPAPGGPGVAPGGQGSAGASVEGAAAPIPGAAGVAGGGGGAAGRIRLNSKSGSADVAAATFSPAASTPCVTQGTVK
jgi:hypothetical protein